MVKPSLLAPRLCFFSRASSPWSSSIASPSCLAGLLSVARRNGRLSTSFTKMSTEFTNIFTSLLLISSAIRIKKI